MVIVKALNKRLQSDLRPLSPFLPKKTGKKGTSSLRQLRRALDKEIDMNKLLFALLMILVPYIAHAERVYETGILQDEAGFVGDDGSKVSNAINMMGV
ncbi:MAG TPA: hypothetical protein DCR51_06395, partial [Idiomarina loihiensis]|nr:hypothetical protein [Idiomarina loihiensis]